MYQSSGVLWLAACYNLIMLFLSDNCLIREAARIQSKYILCEANKLVECLNELNHEDINRQADYAKIRRLSGADYHAKLFGDFGEWLSSIVRP
jgi:hypothetical protein